MSKIKIVVFDNGYYGVRRGHWLFGGYQFLSYDGKWYSSSWPACRFQEKWEAMSLLSTYKDYSEKVKASLEARMDKGKPTYEEY